MNKKLCALVLSAAALGVGSAEAAYVSVTDSSANSARASALNLDGKFDKAFDANIGNPSTNISTSFFHASVNAATGTSGSLDWYSFTTSAANVQAYFDIDFGMPDLDSWVKLYDVNGVEIAQNDDGNVLDVGSSNGFDSFLSRVLTTPGLYYLSVGRYSALGQTTLNAGQDYTLHTSLANYTAPVSQVPVSPAAWLFSTALVGLVGVNRRKSVPAS
ncbi:MAG: hypothetical protein FJ190_06790 [Gammaproteobacteria bacterium]|nr:hypothetical protein [Gammaproteobacteria bacterium]